MSPSAMFSVAVLLLAVTLASFNGHARAQGTTTLVTSFPHFQTFDSWDLCAFDGPCYSQSCPDLRGGWTNENWHSNANASNAVRHWWVNRGPTTSNRFLNGTEWPCSQVQTGPCADHTNGSSQGAYMYAEGSSCLDTYFNLKSPPVRFTNSNAMLSFWYYMHGQNLDAGGSSGSLRVLMSLNGGDFTIELFEQVGEVQDDPTDPWVQFNVTLDSYFPRPANSSNPVTAQFRFRAYIGDPFGDDDAWRNDIAIDDVLFTQAGASSDLPPYEDPPTNSTSTTGSTVITDEGDGITDGQIAGIVVGVVGGLLLCCLLMIILVVVLLLVISPRKPQHLPSGSGPAEDL